MISIIIPVYNVGENLYICLNSILKQNYQNFEIICIDDASTDSSLEILEYFAQKDSRITIIKNNYSLGMGYCRNQGLNLAKGKYVSFLDGNDWLSSNAFEILLENVEKNNLELVLFNEINFNEETHEFSIDECHDVKLINKMKNKVFNHFDLDKTDLLELSHEIWNKFYLKSFLDDNNIRFSDENINYGNIPFFYKVITSADRVSFINDYLYVRRKNQISSIKFVDEGLFDIFTVINDTINVFTENKSLYQYYKKMLLNHIFSKLENKYNTIEAYLQKRFFMEVQSLFINLIKYHRIYDDIVEYVDQNCLIKFNFNEIIEKIENPPKLTIIVPVFNTEDYLPRVLDSIVNQTIGLDDIEVIIVDDCSTDKSGNIIDEYSKKYNSITAIHLLENSESPSKPRNIGIRNASSDYIIFQDSDDGFNLDACECLYDVMIEENVDVITGMIANNGDGKNFNLILFPWDLVLNNYEEYREMGVDELLRSDELFVLKLGSIDENPSVLKDYALNSVLFKKSFLLKNNIRFPEYLNGGEDSVFLFNSYMNAEGIVFINKVIYNYEVLRMDSLTHNYSLKTIQNRPLAYRLMYDLAVLNNKKDFYVKNVLSGKIVYWFNEHLFKAPQLDDDVLLSIFESHQILFSECINYKLDFPEFLMSICKDIDDNNFSRAIDKINKHRENIFNS